MALRSSTIASTVRVMSAPGKPTSFRSAEELLAIEHFKVLHQIRNFNCRDRLRHQRRQLRSSGSSWHWILLSYGLDVFHLLAFSLQMSDPPKDRSEFWIRFVCSFVFFGIIAAIVLLKYFDSWDLKAVLAVWAGVTLTISFYTTRAGDSAWYHLLGLFRGWY
jgi:hypothetical protein